MGLLGQQPKCSHALATSACRLPASQVPRTASSTYLLLSFKSIVSCSPLAICLTSLLSWCPQVAGVAVGHCTIIHGENEEAVRTGVTAVLPRGLGRESSCYAGWFSMNGCGELTGMQWVEESGIATGPYMITGTGSVGLVHDAVLLWAHQREDVGLPGGGLPIVGETYDGRLSLGRHDSVTQPVSPDHVIEALESASDSFVPEGCVGGGTGMITHGFKGGIGTSSRLVDCGRHGVYTVGVLVQSNYGSRELLRIAGAPVGEELVDSFLPSSPPVQVNPAVAHAQGSIIVYVATDAPLLPHQLTRMAKRPALGLGRMVGITNNSFFPSPLPSVYGCRKPVLNPNPNFGDDVANSTVYFYCSSLW